MNELRKDYLLDDWVIISSGRGKRPQPRAEGERKSTPLEKCPFCPGKEEQTPPEILRLPVGGKGWRIRVVPNKFGAVQEHGTIETLNLKYRALKTAFGKHEVIIETPFHDLEMADFTTERIKEIIGVYIERVKALEAIKGVEEVSLFKNQGFSAGASLSHSHSQLIAVNKVSERTKREIKAFNDSFLKTQSCPYCEIISFEMDSQRRVYENQSFACFTPFASSAGFQLSVFPKRHSRHFNEMGEKEKEDLSEILKKALSALKTISSDYNILFHNAPQSATEYHWHISIKPRLMVRAGFEESTDCIINIFSPEDCAAFYREEFAKPLGENEKIEKEKARLKEEKPPESDFSLKMNLSFDKGEKMKDEEK
ncbi:MAG: DUF4931 domain-containing protein [Candidatus Diapherotrites archaeon]|nr:DUF4931 domain-containing protein [Candidatus Diapherotrites archaeon]